MDTCLSYRATDDSTDEPIDAPISIIVEQPEIVLSVLFKYKNLTDLIIEAISKAESYFSVSHFKIEPFTDPESYSDKTSIYLVILDNHNSEESYKIMEKFLDEWWVDNIHRAGGLLSVAVEYV